MDCVFRGRRSLSGMKGYEGAHGFLVREEREIDEVVIWVYRAPASFTGEDMIEIGCHGGSIPARRALEVLREVGARPASPGEFSRRAFLNGRMDLCQAEAVADLIAANGRRAQELALHQLEGGLSSRLAEISGDIRDALVRIEAHLDFGEDVPEAPDQNALAMGLAESRSRLAALAETFSRSRRLREGITVALVGRPNVGKSSLLNRLADEDRALVHASPGTTRDLVDIGVEWAGIPVRLVDTAGIREAAHPVEDAGMERARSLAAVADRVLWVVDASTAPTPEDLEMAASLDRDRVLLVRNKSDLGGDDMWVNIHTPSVATSALTGVGVVDLRNSLELHIEQSIIGVADTESVVVTSERHAHHLETALVAMDRARAVLAERRPLELGGADLHRALAALAAITGERASDQVLDEIFARFCIGK